MFLFYYCGKAWTDPERVIDGVRVKLSAEEKAAYPWHLATVGTCMTHRICLTRAITTEDLALLPKVDQQAYTSYRKAFPNGHVRVFLRPTPEPFIALGMGLHSRLGSLSQLRTLDHGLIDMICNMV